MEIAIIVIAAVLGLGGGAGGVYAYNKKNEKGGKNKAEDLVRKAKNEMNDFGGKINGKRKNVGFNGLSVL